MPPHEAAAAVRLQTDGFVSQAVAGALQQAVDTFRVHEAGAVQHAMRLAADAWALVEAQGALESLASRRARCSNCNGCTPWVSPAGMLSLKALGGWWGAWPSGHTWP